MTARYTSYSTVSGARRHWAVTWTPKAVRCCDRRLTVASSDGPPVRHDEHGDLRGRVRQCGQCGSTYEARFAASEAPAE